MGLLLVVVLFCEKKESKVATEPNNYSVISFGSKKSSAEVKRKMYQRMTIMHLEPNATNPPQMLELSVKGVSAPYGILDDLELRGYKQGPKIESAYQHSHPVDLCRCPPPISMLSGRYLPHTKNSTIQSF